MVEFAESSLRDTYASVLSEDARKSLMAFSTSSSPSAAAGAAAGVAGAGAAALSLSPMVASLTPPTTAAIVPTAR